MYVIFYRYALFNEKITIHNEKRIRTSIPIIIDFPLVSIT